MRMDGAGKTVALVVAGLALGVVTACGSTASDASGDRAAAKIAFLMPESQTLRYESKIARLSSTRSPSSAQAVRSFTAMPTEIPRSSSSRPRRR